MPTESLADRILAAEHLMLARENPEHPYEIEAVRTLKGDLSTVPPVDVFLDSSTRRRLTTNPDLSLLCGWFGEEQGWRQLALHDEVVAPVVADMINMAEAWKTKPDERLRYFAGFLGHEDSELSDLAHIEVARAPYSNVLKYADRIPRDQLHEKLRNFRRMEWHALYILFLSQSDDALDHEFIRKGLDDVARYGLARRTAAFATALIEIDGEAAIRKLSEIYLGNGERRPEEIAALHAALRVHGNEGAPELRDSIVAAYGTLLAQHPALAPDLAEDLTRWKRFDQTVAFSKFLTEAQPDLATTARIRNYLRAAAAVENSTPSQQADSLTPVLAIAGGLLVIPLFLALGGRAKAPHAA